ncbi:hypothetical protein KCU65_g13, partial [Aureobasidium melanogenum]
MSPPIPVLPGSVMFRPAATATAASCILSIYILCDILKPQFEARGCELDTIPLVLCTTLLRLGKATNSGSAAG